MKIGTKIRQIRRHRHMTQRELGERIGLGESGANRIAQYEISYRTPKRDQINKIAYALNVPEERLSLEAVETQQTMIHNLLLLDQDHRNSVMLHHRQPSGIVVFSRVYIKNLLVFYVAIATAFACTACSVTSSRKGLILSPLTGCEMNRGHRIKLQGSTRLHTTRLIPRCFRNQRPA